MPDLAIATLLLTAIAAVYAQVSGHEFLNYDDPVYVTANPHVRNGLTWGGVAWAFSAAHDGNWIPFTWLSHMLDCQLFGVQSDWHHLMNVLFHSANTVLVFLVFKRLSGARWPSAFVAAVFALHPLHVESVAWVAERKDVLSTLFFLLTILAYLTYVERPSVARQAVVATLFCCALLSKPMVVTLPLLLLLLDAGPLNRSSNWRKAVLEKLPFFILAVTAAVIAFLAQRQAGATAALEHVPVDKRVANAVVSYIRYIAAFFWPTKLSVFYPYPTDIPATLWIGSALTLGLGTFLILRSRRNFLIVGWLWYLIALLPVIGFIQVGSQSRADRYTYIPLIGIAIMLAWGMGELLDRVPWRRAALSGLAVAIAAAWAVTAWWNVQYWQSSITLFQHAIASTRDNFVAYTNLGDALRNDGRLNDAILQFQKAAEIRPHEESVLENLGASLANAGRTSEAIRVLLNAVQQFPGSYKMHVDLANALMRERNIDDAETQYRRALQIHPDGAEAQYGLGGSLASRGRVDEARPHLEAGLGFLMEQVRARPNDPDAHYNLGTLYGLLHRSDQAIAELTETVRLVPGDGRAHLNLGIALAAAGRKPEAVGEFAKAAELRPADWKARLNLAEALDDLGRYDDAAREYAEALQIDPTLQEAIRGLEAIKRRPKIPVAKN